jgi:hypothetical protein
MSIQLWVSAVITKQLSMLHSSSENCYYKETEVGYLRPFISHHNWPTNFTSVYSMCMHMCLLCVLLILHKSVNTILLKKKRFINYLVWILGIHLGLICLVCIIGISEIYMHLTVNTAFLWVNIVTFIDCSTRILFMMGLYYLQIFSTIVKFNPELSKHSKTLPQCIVVL